MYYLYRRLPNKNVFRGKVATPEEAKNHLLTDKNGFVEDDKNKVYETIEELEYAESIRSKFEPKLDYDLTEFGEVSEDSDRELSESDTDNTE
jgi:hypothetical protein